MFKLRDKTAPKIVSDWPVTIQVAGDDGRTLQHKVKVTYELISEQEKDAIYADGTDIDFLNRVVRGWKLFQMPDGTDAPCNDDTKALFFAEADVRAGCLNGYFTAAAGGRRKN
jgi:hypothetical protein